MRATCRAVKIYRLFEHVVAGFGGALAVDEAFVDERTEKVVGLLAGDFELFGDVGRGDFGSFGHDIEDLGFFFGGTLGDGESTKGGFGFGDGALEGVFDAVGEVLEPLGFVAFVGGVEFVGVEIAVDVVVVVQDKVFVDAVAGAEKKEGGEDAADAAVAVFEGVDVDELVVEDTDGDDGGEIGIGVDPIV